MVDAGKRPEPAPIPPVAYRQNIVSYVGREGDQETFSYWLTLPDTDDDPETPPSAGQHRAVYDLYGEQPATRAQAGYMMSAWYFADEIRSNKNFKLSAPRRALIHVATAAYILSHPEHRAKVQGWTQFRWRRPTEAVRIERVTAYPAALRFAHDLVADMRAAGATIFG